MEPVVMEQISMYLVGLPCPPIPITLNISSFAKREETDDDDNGDEKERKVCSSHDMLAGLIVSAMHRNNQALNEVRMKKQMEITKNFLDQIEKLEESDVGGMYSACQVFTAYYILSFDDIPAVLGMRRRTSSTNPMKKNGEPPTTINCAIPLWISSKCTARESRPPYPSLLRVCRLLRPRLELK